MDELNWLDEADGRLTRIVIGWPAIEPEVMKIKKHVRYALNNPRAVDLEKAVEHVKGMMTAAMVLYPEFEEHFRPVLER